MLKVPAMLNFMLQVYEPGKYKHDQLRFCWSGAAPLPVALIEAYAKLNIPVHQVYGLTETCGPGCLISGEDALRKAGSTGLAFFHTDVRVVDPSGADAAPGESGEVIVRGKHVMREYWNNPEATAETIRDGWLYTGDGATVDEDGYVYIQDRIKDMIISGGENVYPAEVEGVLMQHPGIGDAAVIGQESARWGESAVAIVVRKDPALEHGRRAGLRVGQAGALQAAGGRRVRRRGARATRRGKVLKRVLREQFPGAGRGVGLARPDRDDAPRPGRLAGGIQDELRAQGVVEVGRRRRALRDAALEVAQQAARARDDAHVRQRLDVGRAGKRRTLIVAAERAA